jgi:hypothetical protein
MFRALEGCMRERALMAAGGMSVDTGDEYWHARRSSGVCNCGAPTDAGTSRCVECKAKRRNGRGKAWRGARP